VKRRLLLAASVMALGACSAPQERAQGEAPGARPPDFELAALDGETVRLSEHLGSEVVLLDFWATFCKPCLKAMPELEGLWQKHRERGLLVLGVSIDGADQRGEVRALIDRMGVTFPILLDQETRVVALYNPRSSAPYSVLIGRDGRVIRKQEGYTTGDHAAVERDIEAALAR
jgi:peroxiredoxin